MRTFSIQTLGCKVNQYESEQLATLLRGCGLIEVEAGADLRIINTCSVTVQAASKSRQAVRRTTRLPVLNSAHSPLDEITPAEPTLRNPARRPRVVVTGCWATSDKPEAQRLGGVDAVLGHHDDLAAELRRLLDRWFVENQSSLACPTGVNSPSPQLPPESLGWTSRAGVPAGRTIATNRPHPSPTVNRKAPLGTVTLPLLDARQNAHQRALLKIQDGCDAHCTYCIIPRLRPRLWSKPLDDVVNEATRLVAAGHVELVLTGIFLSAFGRPTALRRRLPDTSDQPLADLIDALCTRVPGLRRLRFSSLEPGDMTPRLIAALRSHPQVMPHFHLPLQSGSDHLLRRMNRQYTRDDFLRMLDDVNAAFDRPAVTTDIIVGFPGETDAEFERTLEVVDRARFIHIHAFSFSPRPGTAAARWTDDFVHGPIVNQRIDRLNARARRHSYDFRQQFLGQIVESLVEAQGPGEGSLRHGRSERYFDVFFESTNVHPGDLVRVRIDRVTPLRTMGHADCRSVEIR